MISLHRMPHVESMEKDGGCREGNLRQLEHYADLEDEVDALAAVFAFLFRGESVED